MRLSGIGWIRAYLGFQVQPNVAQTQGPHFSISVWVFSSWVLKIGNSRATTLYTFHVYVVAWDVVLAIDIFPDLRRTFGCWASFCERRGDPEVERRVVESWLPKVRKCLFWRILLTSLWNDVSLPCRWKTRSSSGTWPSLLPCTRQDTLAMGSSHLPVMKDGIRLQMNQQQLQHGNQRLHQFLMLQWKNTSFAIVNNNQSWRIPCFLLNHVTGWWFPLGLHPENWGRDLPLPSLKRTTRWMLILQNLSSLLETITLHTWVPRPSKSCKTT